MMDSYILNIYVLIWQVDYQRVDLTPLLTALLVLIRLILSKEV